MRMPGPRAVLPHVWWFALPLFLAVLLALALSTATGARLVVSVLSGGQIRLEGVQGSLLGPLAAEQVLAQLGERHVRLEKISLSWRPLALLRRHIEIDRLAIGAALIVAPAGEEKLQPPRDLRVPVTLRVQNLHVGRLEIRRQPSEEARFSALGLTASLDSDGGLHRILSLTTQLPQGKLSAQGSVEAVAPFSLAAEVRLRSEALRDFAAGGEFDGEQTVSARIAGYLTDMTISGDASGKPLSGTFSARLRPFEPIPLAALKIDAKGLDPAAFSADWPSAKLSVQTELQGTTNGGLAGSISGRNADPRPFDRGGVPLAAIEGILAVHTQSLRLDDARLRVADSEILRGNVHWDRQTATAHAEFAVRNLNAASLHSRLRRTALNGSMKLTGDAARQQADLSLRDAGTHVVGRLFKTGPLVTLDTLRATRGSAEVTAGGQIELDGVRRLQLKGNLRHFDVAAFADVPRSDLNGQWTANGNLSPKPNGALAFAITPSRFAGQPLTAEGNLAWQGGVRARGEITARFGDNHIDLRGGVGAPEDSVSFTVDAPALSQLGQGFGGSLHGRGTLGGSLAVPRADFEILGRNVRFPGGHSLSTIDVTARVAPKAINVKVDAEDYAAGNTLRARRMELAVSGTPDAHTALLDVSLTDNRHARARLEGGYSLGTPGRGAIWKGRLRQLEASLPAPIRLETPTEISFEGDRVIVGPSELTVAGGRIRHSGSQWTPEAWSSRGRFTGISSGLPESEDAVRLGGDWQIVAKTGRIITGAVNVVREGGDLVIPAEPPVALGLSEFRLNARAADGVLRSELVATGSRLGRWQGSWTIPLSRVDRGLSRSTPINGKLTVDAGDLSWVGPLLDGNYRTGGKLRIDATIGGSLASPQIVGKADGADLVLFLLDQGIRLQSGSLAAHFDSASLYVDKVEFDAPRTLAPPDRRLTRVPLGNGRLTVGGLINFRTKTGHLDVRADRMPVSQRRDRWIVASGAGRAELGDGKLKLRGNVIADAGFISGGNETRPELSPDVRILGQETRDRRPARVDVEIGVDLGDHFFIQVAGLDARLAGQLRVRGEPNRLLRTVGSIATTDATFEAYGQRLTVERGIVNFQGPIDNPGLNILATRKGLAVEAGVEVTGTVRRPVVRLVSTPVVPDPEKLSWIVLGRKPETGTTDPSLLLTATRALFGNQASSLTGEIARSFGLDELSVREAAAGETLRGQIVSLGKRLSSQAYLTYEQGVSAAAAGVVKFTYILNRHLSVVTRAGTENSVDVYYTFSFD